MILLALLTSDSQARTLTHSLTHSLSQPAKLHARCSMIEFHQSADLPMALLYVVFKDLDLAKLQSFPPSVPRLVVVVLKSQIHEAHGLWSLKPKTRGT